jgi:pantoate--beta-alanine ligase
MYIVRTKSELREQINNWKAQGHSVGFVPTMGALHSGHLSLVKRALAENRHCVVSIFVNPTQFNERSDYQSYPRTEDTDTLLLESSGADLIFMPEEQEMYHNQASGSVDIDLEGLDEPMEGACRPGHFKGVVEIVDKLFSLVSPDRAYFGQKDFQQLAIVRLLALKRHPGVAVIACPIVREPSGLAMSSRNRLLNSNEMEKAAEIYRALRFIQMNQKQMPLKSLLRGAREILDLAGEPEYLEAVDRERLQPVNEIGERPVVVCTAVRVGRVRLIDNIEIP